MRNISLKIISRILLILLISTFCKLGSGQKILYNYYNKYENINEFRQFEISNNFFSLLNIFSKETKPINAILAGINTFKIAILKNDKTKEYPQFVNFANRQFAKKRYKIFLKDKKKEKGKSFYVRANIRYVKEFHFVKKDDTQIMIVSINGKIPIEHLEAVGKFATQGLQKILKVKDLH